MPTWNKPHRHDTEHPARTIAGAIGVVLFGVGGLAASFWVFRFVMVFVRSHGGWGAAVQTGRHGGPNVALLFWLALSFGAFLVGAYCWWVGVRWFWVGVGAWRRGEMVDDDDPNTSPDDSDD